MTKGKRNQKQKVSGTKTFPVILTHEGIKENTQATSNIPLNLSKEKIIHQAFKSHSEGNLEEAIKYYQNFIDQGFQDHRVFANYGSILKSLGKLKDAELLLRKAIELNPYFAGAHYNLGNLLKIQGNLKDAELSFRKAIQLNPSFAEAHSNLGTILRTNGRLQDAEVSTRKAIELKPDYAEAHSNLGNILHSLGRLESAELSFRKAIAITPDLENVHFNIGNILKKIGKYKEAITAYKEEIKVNPNNADAHLNVGLTLKELDKIKEKEKSTSKSSIIFIPSSNFEIIGKDMILIDFMTPHECEKMIELAEGYGEFREAEYDKVSGQELRLTKLGLWEELANHWMKYINNIVYDYYHPCRLFGLLDAFIIKYSMDSQKSLRLHTDMSLVTGSIKLNDDYEGGELFFPRQGISNKDIEVGKCILFPGQCTHGHTSQELISGTKYSLTIWTKRDEQDW